MQVQQQTETEEEFLNRMESKIQMLRQRIASWNNSTPQLNVEQLNTSQEIL